VTTTYDYTTEDLANPVGNNSLSSRAKFYQRSLYKEAIYPTDIVRPLDSWYDKNLYGRVNQQQTVIIPSQEDLVQIQYGVQPNMFSLSFVNRAFTDFVEHMKTAYMTNCINRNGNPSLINMRAIISYKDWDSSWITHRNNIINAFIQNYNPKFSSPIKNFQDFKPLFTYYLLNMAKKMPITRTSFVLSPFASTFGSGLKIAIAQLDAGNDQIKYLDFINDPNFKFYARAAKKFGFLVDKYVPWVLTYDLFTNASLNYIDYYVTNEGNPITEQNFFDTFYHDSYKDDMMLLQEFVRNAYEKFVTLRPIYEEEKSFLGEGCSQSQLLNAKFREQLGSNSLSLEELIDLYIQLRYVETEMQGPSVKKTKARAYEIYRSQPELNQAKIAVSKFVDETYKNFIYPKNYGQLNPSLDIAVLSDIVDTVAETAVAIQSTY
jgi:hypothetical protein